MFFLINVIVYKKHHTRFLLILETMLHKEKLEQLKRLRSEDTPAASWLPILLSHIGYQVKEDKVKVANLKHLPKIKCIKTWNKPSTQHTFWSCLMRCANMKWIRRVLLKIQSGNDYVHRRTDRRTDKVNRFVEAVGMISHGLSFLDNEAIVCDAGDAK